MSSHITVELRCPVGPKRLFSKLILAGDRPRITSGNLVEFACADCRKSVRATGQPCRLVLHRFDLVGELVESVILE